MCVTDHTKSHFSGTLIEFTCRHQNLSIEIRINLSPGTPVSIMCHMMRDDLMVSMVLASRIDLMSSQEAIE